MLREVDDEAWCAWWYARGDVAVAHSDRDALYVARARERVGGLSAGGAGGGLCKEEFCQMRFGVQERLWDFR
ncbi:hypothetical protein GCM10023320_23920 [Pseudonocardia adelaidensis]|uniref:Uncharacterized protein n=1 Tax=Pseudonocardia adelaidensis TaxID=648754 RepID=A0ABP9NGZ8_9PSEU